MSAIPEERKPSNGAALTATLKPNRSSFNELNVSESRLEDLNTDQVSRFLDDLQSVSSLLPRRCGAAPRICRRWGNLLHGMRSGALIRCIKSFEAVGKCSEVGSGWQNQQLLCGVVRRCAALRGVAQSGMVQDGSGTKAPPQHHGIPQRDRSTNSTASRFLAALHPEVLQCPPRIS